MPLVYCDHNFIASAHDSLDPYQARLQAATARVTFVLSPWHWLDMARDKNERRSQAVADIADSLNPLWLYDRRTLQRREVLIQLFLGRGILYEIGQPIGTKRDVVADLSQTPPLASPPRSAEFVRHMRRLGADHPLEITLRDNFDKQEKNRTYYRDGKITPLNFPHFDHLYIQNVMEKTVSVRLPQPLDRTLIDEFPSRCRKELLPSIALEMAVARDAWTNDRALTENEFRDVQHMMALPYVDVFVTNDRRMTAILTRVIPSLPFRTAEIIDKVQFDRRFLA